MAPRLPMPDWTRRVSKDLQDLLKNDSGKFLIADHADDLRRMEVVVYGEEGTSFEGGVFEIALEIPRDYPCNPPRARFITSVFHPNISTAGTICVDILERENWSSGTTLIMVVEALSALLNMPNADSPLNVDAGSMLLNDREMYEETVKAYCHVFAGAPDLLCDPVYMQKIAQVVAFTHCSKERALMRLSVNKWNVADCYRQTGHY